ncbi:MAG TPA: hydantoinase/oxoprolinase family protein [Solirubrobacter sp.]|nr:hydantoinase/oxoprolinase family protein [Solirubrobacter sp.]
MRLGVDIGGTFTDLVAYDAERELISVSKVLNDGTGPEGGVRRALAGAGVAQDAVAELTHGTTLITNLLIERNGATVGVLCTRGFRDLLEIQLSWRERTFDLGYVKPAALVPRPRRLEIGGRIDFRGREVEPLDPAEVSAAIHALLEQGVDSLAVALYNAYANPEHERTVERIAADVAPGLPVTLSTAVDARVGEYERASTAALNAMAVPRMDRYVAELDPLVEPPIRYMHSAGGVIHAREARTRPIQLALSGPAAGVLAGREVAAALGYANAITMDMGGTSCDVCLIWDGELARREEVAIEWGVIARLPTLDVHTVGAGGGSIAWRDDGGALRVGPRSAGALPGPACYGRGGTAPTVTDANLALGILPGGGLLGGSLALDTAAATAALETLGAQFATPALELARGMHAIANANMAQTIREITVSQGIDPRDCALVAFGGAGPQHATGVAQELGIGAVVIPAEGSVLSAVGLLTAELQAGAVRSVLRPIAAIADPAFAALLAELEREAGERLGEPAGDGLVATRSAGLRYEGQSHELTIPLDGGVDDVVERFEDAHERLYGTRLGHPVEIVDARVEVRRARGVRPAVLSAVRDTADGAAADERDCPLFGEPVPVHRRAALEEPALGPCLVEERNTVTVVPPGASARLVGAHLVVTL